MLRISNRLVANYLSSALVSLSFLTSFLTTPAACQTLAPEFMSLDLAKPALEKFGTGTVNANITGHDWLIWLRNSDKQVRQRLEAGEEDSLTNLLRFGVTYTTEYRIDDEYLLRYGQSSLVNSFANNRANDLIKALATANQNQGFIEMRAFVERQGYSVNSAEGRSKLKAHLLTNLTRMQKELQQAREHAASNPNQAFEHRGISLDSKLWPDFDLDLALRKLLSAGQFTTGQVRRVAIVGPGLDFVNKQAGVDYYPPQTTQPFAVMDSLLRLGLAKPGEIEIYTLDISPRVNLHLETARKSAAQGKSYVVQLPWYEQGRWSEDFRTSFTQYWRGLGTQIGEPVQAIPVPAEAPGFATRAVRIRPAIVMTIKAIDMNIVYQTLSLSRDERFDLVVGTNIFIYYGQFEQSLARANVANLLRPGGFLLSNQQLDETAPSGLKQVTRVDIPMTNEPVIADHIYCYRREP